ncbi:hypothetical protein [Enterococcus faecalis]|uniref:hypothetical protein n=1 Tax=Enterococcus faecalis TaxID=1351 RepID=UPI0035ABBAB4
MAAAFLGSLGGGNPLVTISCLLCCSFWWQAVIVDPKENEVVGKKIARNCG